MSKPMSVLIGYDGSPCASAALDDLQWAGLHDDISVTILTVADVMGPPTGDEVTFPTDDWYPLGMSEARTISAEMVEQAEMLAHMACERLRKEYPTWHVESDVCAGSPASCLMHKAETRGADLVIVGSHGRSQIGRIFLGSVSQALVTEAHTSVRVARTRRAEPGRRTSILVGFDGSAQSKLAVRAAAERAWPKDTRLHLVTAVDPMLVTALAATAPAIGFQQPAYSDTLTEVHRMLDETAESVTMMNPALDVSVAAEEGDPKRVLLKEAERFEADCIFVGARGHTRLQRLLVGSVSAAVAARAHCAVEVVRPPLIVHTDAPD